MNNDFANLMQNKSDADLVKIVTVERDQYQPHAISAAEAEIENRKMDPEIIEKLSSDFRNKQAQKTNFESRFVGSHIRFVNCIIDTILILILSRICTYIADFLIPNFEPEFLLFFTILNFYAYYFYLELKYQKTPGKYITKTSVVNPNGEQPGKNEIRNRTLARFIPFDRISFIFVPNGIHDRLSKTTVVKDIA